MGQKLRGSKDATVGVCYCGVQREGRGGSLFPCRGSHEDPEDPSSPFVYMKTSRLQKLRGILL